MKHLLMPLLLATLAGCGDSPGSTTTGTADAEAQAAEEARPKPWVDKSTVDALPEGARASLGQAQGTPATGPEYVALVEKLNSEDAATRITAVRAISLTMANAKGDYYEALRRNVGRYLGVHGREFIGLFSGTNNMGKSELKAWATILRGGEGATANADASRVLQGLKQQCSDCTATDIEVLDLFIGMATGEGGKGGKATLK